MKLKMLGISSFVIGLMLTACTSSNGVYTDNGRVYRAPDGGYYRIGDVYKDRNGNTYKNGKVYQYGNVYGNGNLPPGQAKKIFVDKSEKRYAPGQNKKSRDWDHKDHKDKKGKKKGKKHRD